MKKLERLNKYKGKAEIVFYEGVAISIGVALAVAIIPLSILAIINPKLGDFLLKTFDRTSSISPDPDFKKPINRIVLKSETEQINLE